MNQTAAISFKAIAATMPLPEDGTAPDWIHLLPAGGEIRTFDGRGPCKLGDAGALIAASMSVKRLNGDLPIDENHSTDLKGVAGGQAPALGWIKELQARTDGVWGRVVWNAAGKTLVEGRAYRGISPVFEHSADGQVQRLLRAGLTNQPNLLGLVALNQESSVNFIDQLRTKRGLSAMASEADILADVPAKGTSEPALQSAMTALQSTVAQIAIAVGAEASNLPALLAAVSAKVTQAAGASTAQTELATLSTQVAAMQVATKRTGSEVFVDAEIAKKRNGLSAATRERWVTLHMEQPDNAKAMIEAMPCLGESHTAAVPPRVAGAALALNAEQQGRVLHDHAVAYQSAQKVKGLTISLFDAIQHVNKEVQL